MNGNYCQGESAVVRRTHRASSDDRRVGNVGVMLIEAAKQGLLDSLELLLELPQGQRQVDYTEGDNLETPLVIAAKNGHLECVKLLISYGADITRYAPQRHWLTSRSKTDYKHPGVAAYIQQCLQDLKDLNTTRAHLERMICALASSPSCTASELRSFSMSLRNLSWLHKCSVGTLLDKDSQSLLHRAVQANNFDIVLMLLDEFKANPMASNKKTGETILHTACRMKSDLRFFITKRHTELLRKRNTNISEAELPLHIACATNDINFISWLFKNILAQESALDEICSISHNKQHFRRGSLASVTARRVKLVRQAQLQPKLSPQYSSERKLSETRLLSSGRPLVVQPANGEEVENQFCSPISDDLGNAFSSTLDSDSTSVDNANPAISSSDVLLPQRKQSLEVMKMADILKESPLTISEVCMLLTSLTSTGDSVFHILARKNFPELLTRMFKVAEFIYWRIELNMLLNRYKTTSYLPIEEAIQAKSVDCIQIIIHFMNISGQLRELLQDSVLLQRAVHTTDLAIIKIFIKYGFHKGLQSAICEAVKMEKDEILRVLLYYETQVVNALESSHITRDQIRALHPSNGTIKWEGCDLDHIDPEWLYDSYDAISSVVKTFSLIPVVLSTDDNHFFFQQLGQNCLRYFSQVVTSPISNKPSQHFTVITKVDLNRNQLAKVPLDLFQLPSLQCLYLSNNKLQCLPSSDSLSERLYTAPIASLDLDHNQLKTIPERLFRDLAHSLVDLNASWNCLENLPPGMWISPKLKKLRLSHNRLSQLHCLSGTQYFDDQALSSTIMASFTVSDGILLCNNTSKRENLHEVKDYLHTLADYRHTVRAVKFPCNESLSSHNNTMYDVIGIHLLRSEFYRASTCAAEQHERTQSTPTIEGEPLFPVNSGEEDSPICVIEELDLSYNNFSEFPWNLPCVTPQLRKLHIENNRILDIDIIHSVPRYLESLFLDKNNIRSLRSDRLKWLPCGHPFRLLTIPDSNSSHGRYCGHCKHKTLDNLLLLSANHNQLCDFPTMQVAADSSSLTSEPLYPKLSLLSLESNRLQCFPADLHHLTKLSSVKVSHNEIRELPSEAGLLNSQQLFVLKMDGMNLRNIPAHLLRETTPKRLLNYLKAIQHNSKPYHRIKLMVVGECNTGKTFLLNSLTRRGKFKDTELSLSMSNDTSYQETTSSVVIKNWKYAPRNKTKITFMVWDFVGQEEYYAIHQCFLSKRSLYLLVWSIQDGEAGVRRLKTWLENIEGCASNSPVIIVATQLNLISESNREKVKAQYSQLILDLYVNYSHSAYQYPCIKQIMFINNQEDTDRLRDYIHDLACKYKLSDSKGSDSDNIVDQLIPAFCLQLQNIVHSIIADCRVKNVVPIFDKEAYRCAIEEAGFSGSIDELHEATTFLHDNGILRHFDKSTRIGDIYFLDVQWLCSNLTKVVTIREDIPSHKNGFLRRKDLELILGASYKKELVALMEEFEIIFFLDESHLLIPSLLPQDESMSCPVFSNTAPEIYIKDGAVQLEDVPRTPIHTIPHKALVRYYLLPFVPNGFFARVIARLISTNMIDYVQKSLQVGPLDDGLTNRAHWRCWRDGISMIWHHMEIFCICPVTFPLPGTTETRLISSEGEKSVETGKGIEIKVAVMPEEINVRSNCYPNEHSGSPVSAHCRAAWLLHQATNIVNSVFEDWYEVFGKGRSFDLTSVTANVCTECLDVVTLKSSCQSENSTFYLFSSPYCSRVVADGNLQLECPVHGKQSFNTTAPDLAFKDFASSLVFCTSDCLTIGQSLGHGGFGSVYQASLKHENAFGQQCVMEVAVKEFNKMAACTGDRSSAVLAEKKAWEIYENASREARVMVQLQHSHILRLMGITLRPLRLLVELAPMGDMTSCIRKFKKATVRLRRTTVQTTLVQVAEAINYIHSKHFVYRDLKPGNILVFKFPEPDTQWNSNTKILVKVADYGISKQVSPEGLRGGSGTPPYLPPEVNLTGGREAASTMIDVYAFGMFIYYLMTFMTPFEMEVRPLNSLLEEGRRPELPPKLHPQSLQLYELMCWCWSDKPQQRPNFEQILKIVRRDSIMHLLEAVPVTNSRKNLVTAACVKVNTGLRQTSTLTSASSFISTCTEDLGLQYGTTTKVLSPIEIWYGTKTGYCGVIRFKNTAAIKTFKLPSEEKIYISSVVAVGSHVWIGTGGLGLFVYWVQTHKSIASWGQERKNEVFTLLHIKKTNSVLALTHEGMFVFDTHIGRAASLQYRLHIPRMGRLEFNEGVVIPQAGNVEETEVWVCCRSSHGFSILNYKKFDVIEEVQTRGSQEGRVVRNIQTMLVNAQSYLAVANRHLVEIWDVKQRKKKNDCDMLLYCKEFYGDQRHNYRITSMTTYGDLLYIGTGGGVLLALRCSTMELHFAYHAYSDAIRSLLVILPKQQTIAFTRLMSFEKSQIQVDDHCDATTQQMDQTEDSQSPLRNTNKRLHLNLKPVEPLPAERSVLISFGHGYRGVVGDYANYPQEFILPSQGKKAASKPAKPCTDDGHLLIWSTEHDTRDLKRVPRLMSSPSKLHTLDQSR